MEALRSWLVNPPESPESKKSSSKVPVLPQRNFVYLWRTLHDMFMEQPSQAAFQDLDVQRLYHSVAIVGTLILQIGEVSGLALWIVKGRSRIQLYRIPFLLLQVGKKVKSSPSQQQLQQEQQHQEDAASSSRIDKGSDDWSITFQQFIASFLNEPPLVDYFERKVDLMEGLQKMKAAKLKRQESGVTSSGSGGGGAGGGQQQSKTGGSVFYV